MGRDVISPVRCVAGLSVGADGFEIDLDDLRVAITPLALDRLILTPLQIDIEEFMFV
jgi:hypothetical protein